MRSLVKLALLSAIGLAGCYVPPPHASIYIGGPRPYYAAAPYGAGPTCRQVYVQPFYDTYGRYHPGYSRCL